MSKVVGVLLWYILRLLILASLVSNYRSFSLEKLYTDPLVNLHMQVVLSNLLLIIQSDHILNSCTFQDFRTGTTTRFQLNWDQHTIIFQFLFASRITTVHAAAGNRQCDQP
jgi:hypothetical protein